MTSITDNPSFLDELETMKVSHSHVRISVKILLTGLNLQNNQTLLEGEFNLSEIEKELDKLDLHAICDSREQILRALMSAFYLGAKEWVYEASPKLRS
jgi:hypothetical protein